MLNTLGSILLSIGFGFWSYRKYQQAKRHPDAAWKTHVEYLRSQGINEDSIKRTSEWEETQLKQLRRMKETAILFGIVFPIFIVVFSAIMAVINRCPLPEC